MFPTRKLFEHFEEPSPDKTTMEVFGKAEDFLAKYPIQKFMRDEAIQKQSDLEQELIEDFKFIPKNNHLRVFSLKYI